jgi:sortase system peptidoglycan-associated protein
MKKSFLNHAIIKTLSSAVLSTAIISPGVMAGAYESNNPDAIIQSELNTSSSDTPLNDTPSIETPLTDTIQINSVPIASVEPAPVDNPNENPDIVSATSDISADQEETSRSFTSEMGVGIGVGAATGGLVAGPVGLIVGGIVGAFIGSNHEIAEQDESSVTTTEASEEDSLHAESIVSDDSSAVITAPEQDSSLQLAQLGQVAAVIESPVIKSEETLVDVLTSDLSFDVYFRSGSTEIEDFYPARLIAVSQLLDEIDELEVHLDGYADRRGDKDKNIALSNERINSVRQALIDSGVDENRIISKAYGEMKMVSAAGDLEAYTFDRKVVIRFERASSDSLMNMHKVLSDVQIDDTSDSDSLVANHTTRF